MSRVEVKVPEPLQPPLGPPEETIPQPGERRPDGTAVGEKISFNEWLRLLREFVRNLTSPDKARSLALPPLENRHDLQQLEHILDQLDKVLPAVFSRLVDQLNQHHYYTSKQYRLVAEVTAAITTSQRDIHQMVQHLRQRLAALENTPEADDPQPFGKIAGKLPLWLLKAMAGLGVTIALLSSSDNQARASDSTDTAGVVDGLFELPALADDEAAWDAGSQFAATGAAQTSVTDLLAAINDQLTAFERQFSLPDQVDGGFESEEAALLAAMRNPDTVISSSLDRSVVRLTLADVDQQGWRVEPFRTSLGELEVTGRWIKLTVTTQESAAPEDYWINRDQLPPVITEPPDPVRDVEYQPLPNLLGTAHVKAEITQGAIVRAQATRDSTNTATLTAGSTVRITGQENGQTVTVEGESSSLWYQVEFTNALGQPQTGMMSALLLTEPEPQVEQVRPAFNHTISPEFLEQLTRLFPGSAQQSSFALVLQVPENTNGTLVELDQQALQPQDILFVRSLDDSIRHLFQQNMVQLTENTRTMAIITVDRATREISISFKHERRQAGDQPTPWQATALFALVDGQIRLQPISSGQRELVVQLTADQAARLRRAGYNQLSEGDYVLAAVAPDGDVTNPAADITPLSGPVEPVEVPVAVEVPLAVPVPEPPQAAGQETPPAGPTLQNFVTPPAAEATELSNLITPEAIDEARLLSPTTQPVLTEDSRVVLPTPYDPPDSPRYELRRGSWRDNHPGRKEIEETLPSNFFELFSPEEVRWDLEYSLYRFRDGSFFVPALGTELVNGSYDQDDLEDGRSTFQFELTHPDFELGVSGVRISVLLSGNNPDIHQLGLWEGLLQDHERFLAVTRALTETLTEDFPQARGKHLIYAIAADDITAREVSFNRDNGLRGDIVNEMGLRYHRTSNQDTLLIKSSLHLSDRSAFDRPDLNLVAPSRYHYANFGERVITMVFVGFYRTLGLGREFSDPQPANNTSGRAKTRIRDIITGNDQFTSLGQVGEDRPYSLLVINNEPVFND